MLNRFGIFGIQHSRKLKWLEHVHLYIKRWMLRIWSFLSIHQIDSHINTCNQRTPLTKWLVHSINCYKITLHMIEFAHTYIFVQSLTTPNGKRTVGKEKPNQFSICARRHASNSEIRKLVWVRITNPIVFTFTRTQTHNRRSMVTRTIRNWNSVFMNAKSGQLFGFFRSNKTTCSDIQHNLICVIGHNFVSARHTYVHFGSN